jgi:hypothetical protein
VGTGRGVCAAVRSTPCDEVALNICVLRGLVSAGSAMIESTVYTSFVVWHVVLFLSSSGRFATRVFSVLVFLSVGSWGRGGGFRFWKQGLVI